MGHDGHLLISTNDQHDTNANINGCMGEENKFVWCTQTIHLGTQKHKDNHNNNYHNYTSNFLMKSV